MKFCKRSIFDIVILIFLFLHFFCIVFEFYIGLLHVDPDVHVSFEYLGTASDIQGEAEIVFHFDLTTVKEAISALDLYSEDLLENFEALQKESDANLQADLEVLWSKSRNLRKRWNRLEAILDDDYCRIEEEVLATVKVPDKFLQLGSNSTLLASIEGFLDISGDVLSECSASKSELANRTFILKSLQEISQDALTKIEFYAYQQVNLQVIEFGLINDGDYIDFFKYLMETFHAQQLHADPLELSASIEKTQMRLTEGGKMEIRGRVKVYISREKPYFLYEYTGLPIHTGDALYLNIWPKNPNKRRIAISRDLRFFAPVSDTECLPKLDGRWGDTHYECSLAQVISGVYCLNNPGPECCLDNLFTSRHNSTMKTCDITFFSKIKNTVVRLDPHSFISLSEGGEIICVNDLEKVISFEAGKLLKVPPACVGRTTKDVFISPEIVPFEGAALVQYKFPQESVREILGGYCPVEFGKMFDKPVPREKALVQLESRWTLSGLGIFCGLHTFLDDKTNGSKLVLLFLRLFPGLAVLISVLSSYISVTREEENLPQEPEAVPQIHQFYPLRRG